MSSRAWLSSVPIVLLATWSAASSAGAAARVGAWEGSTEAGDYITFDVERTERGRRIVRAGAFYRCNGEPAFTRWRRVEIVGGRFAARGLTEISGRVRSRRRIGGRVDPSPGLGGCHGGATPFVARFEQRRRAHVPVGDYEGADSLGNAIAVEVGTGGRMIAQFASGIEFTCGDRRFGNIIRRTAPVRVDGSFDFVSRATPSSRFSVRLSGRFVDGIAGGSYTVLPDFGCTETTATFSADRH